MQHAAQLCALLANQRGLVANSYALRVSLITHLFLRVIPLPLPRKHLQWPRRCFWAGAHGSGKPISHDTQAPERRSHDTRRAFALVLFTTCTGLLVILRTCMLTRSSRL